MTSTKIIAEITALQDAALEDLMAATDEQLRKEAIEDGEDLIAIAAQVKTSMNEASAEALRQRLTDAKKRMKAKPPTLTQSVVRPPLDQIKQIIQGLFQKDQNLGLAFRDGKRQTDADWLSLYDDLVDLGAIKSNNHEH